MGRNLVKFKKIDDVIFNLKVWRHHCHFNVSTTKKVGSLHCFLVFEWIKLKFSVRGYFWLLISNLSSKTQYWFKVLKKFHLSSLRSWFLAQQSLMNWLPWQQWMTCLQSFNFKRYYRWLPKNEVCWKSVEPFLRYSSKTLENLQLFSCRILMTS